MKYEISEKAVQDIDDIWLYTMENWSIEQADRYYNLIFDEIEFVCANFNAGKDIGDLRTGYRSSKVKSHLIFYKRSEKDSVLIVRVLHQRMDVDNRLYD